MPLLESCEMPKLWWSMGKYSRRSLVFGIGCPWAEEQRRNYRANSPVLSTIKETSFSVLRRLGLRLFTHLGEYDPKTYTR